MLTIQVGEVVDVGQDICRLVCKLLQSQLKYLKSNRLVLVGHTQWGGTERHRIF